MTRKHDKTGRSKGTGRHVRLYHWMLESASWQNLDATARGIYIDLLTRYNGFNNGRISYSVREAERSLHIGKSNAARALQRLDDGGFITPLKKGGFSRKDRHSTEWRLTEFNCDVTGEVASKAFMNTPVSVPVAGPKKQNAVPGAGLTVPVAGQYGTYSGTMNGENGLDGTCSGTVEAAFGNPRYPQRDTCSIPRESAAGEHTRGRVGQHTKQRRRVRS